MNVFTASFGIDELNDAALPVELDSRNTLVLAFAGIESRPANNVIARLSDTFPKSVLVSCSSGGEIIGGDVKDGVVSLSVIQFAETKIRSVGLTAANFVSSKDLGCEIAQMLDGPDLAGVFIFSDSGNVNGEDLVRGISAGLSPSVVIAGGFAGSGAFPGWVSGKGEARSQWVTTVGLYGDQIHIGHGCFGGWDAFGPKRVITRSEGQQLFELDHKPALPLFKEYLGDLAAGLPQTGLRFPLALRRRGSDRDFVIRTILQIDEESQSLLFGGDLPQGWSAQLMRGNLERLIEGSAQSARQAQMSVSPGSPSFALAVSCLGRRGVLRERVSEELVAVLDILGPSTNLAGFYSGGEIAPQGDGPAKFHNQTMTLTTLREN